MLNITNALLVMISLFNAGLTIFMLRGNARRASNLFLGIYFASLCVWPLMLIGTQIGSSYVVWFSSAKATYIAGLVIAASFYLFSIAFPEEEYPAWLTVNTVYGLVLAYALCEFLFPSFLVRDVVATPTGNAAILEPVAYLTFTGLFCFLYVGGLIRIIGKYRRAAGLVRRRLLVIWLGVAITGIGGLYYDIFLASPFINDFQYIWTGPLFNTVTAGLIVYAVFRLGFLNAKVILTELLVGLLWIFTFLRTLVATDPREQIFNGGLFVFSLAVGSLLAASVRREVEQRERIEKLAAELEETNSRQEGLIRFISHEVKGFLTKDQGAFAALLEGDFGELAPELKPFVERALGETRTGVESVMNILKASNQKKGTTEYKKEPFDMEAVARDAVAKLAARAKDKGLTLSFSCDPAGAPYVVVGDKTEISDHVLRNLIDNSINYTPSGSISVSLRKENGKAVFAVKDTGVGITEEDKLRLFTEGGHGKNSQSINVNSTGYGLFIAKNIVVAHGGAIRAESEGQGKGSTFIVELPASAPVVK